MSLSVFALLFLSSCSSMKSSVAISRRENFGTSSILFLTESHVLVVHHCKVLSFVSLTGRTMIFQSLAFLIVWLGVCLARILDGLFSCVNLSMFEVSTYYRMTLTASRTQ